jgi:hypothetical protein
MMGVTVGDERDPRAGGCPVVELIAECLHDEAPPPPPLVLWQDADVNDLQVARTIADDPAHSDGSTCLGG